MNQEDKAHKSRISRMVSQVCNNSFPELDLLLIKKDRGYGSGVEYGRRKKPGLSNPTRFYLTVSDSLKNASDDAFEGGVAVALARIERMRSRWKSCLDRALYKYFPSYHLIVDELVRLNLKRRGLGEKVDAFYEFSGNVVRGRDQ